MKTLSPIFLTVAYFSKTTKVGTTIAKTYEILWFKEEKSHLIIILTHFIGENGKYFAKD